MKKDNKHINDFYLSQWIAGEIDDDTLKNLVSNSDFLSYKKIQKGLNLISDLNKPLDDSFEKIQKKITNKPKVRALNYKWIASIAAMLLFFIGFYQFLGSDGVLTTTTFGEQKTVALLDGSEVILNAKSALNYHKKSWKNNREVYLNGEAFFKVKKGNSFTVKTKNGDVIVLGTQFTVKSTQNYFEVICFQGKVKVIKNDVSVILHPSESFRKIKNYASEQLTYKTSQPTWLTGESSYRSVPLKYVIADFEKQYHIKIDSSNIDDTIIFTGSFSHKNINVALKSIFTALNIKYKKATNKIILQK